MSSLEFNKIAAAVLTAGVIAMSSGFIAKLLMHPKALEENVYVVAVEAGDDDAGDQEEPGLESILPLLAAADLEAGAKVARKCTACHTFEQGGADKIGPNLWDSVNRQVASVEGFGYSGALEERAGEVWSYDNLNAFLADPKGWAPGTKMSFAGLRKVGDRASLVAYMRSLSDDPVPLPSEEDLAALQPAEAEAESAEATAEAAPAAENAPAAAQQAAADGASSLGALIAAADPEAGKKVARKCTACHTFEQGGANKLGPNLYDILGTNVASIDGFRYSKGLVEKAGESWSYENLDAFLASPKTWAPGTKMTFAGLRKPEDRAAILAFMRGHSDDPPALPE